jgi:predicted nucleic acid-binding Zn ribbon protein
MNAPMPQQDRLCLKCGNAILFRRLDAQFCSEACRLRARDKRRRPMRALRKALERARRRKDKRCQTCNADISQRHGRAIYCSRKCWESSQYKSGGPRPCRECQQPILRPKQLCDPCRAASKIKQRQRQRELRQGRGFWVNQAPTIEERLRRKAVAREIRHKYRAQIIAANQAYRELMGNEKTPRAVLPPSFCVVCGIFITGYRKRNLCSRACSEERNRERASARYYEIVLPKTPRMIATTDFRGAGKFRDYRDQRHRTRPYRPRTERQRERDREREHIYRAMKELNLVQQEDQ